MNRGSEVGSQQSAGSRGKLRTENGGLPTGGSETIPRGWIEIDLDKIVIYGKGKKPKTLTPKNDIGLVPYINIKGFEKGIIDEYADVKSSKLINKTDILVVWDGARFGLTGMGMEGAAGSTLMVLTPLLNKPEYLYNFINRHYSYINSKPKGTGTPHVNPDIFWKLQFPIAPLNEQKRIVARLDKIMPRIAEVKERLDKVPAIVKRFRQSVLTAAVNGKLTEKWRAEHPDVESAEVLLERIKNDREIRYKKECVIAKNKHERKPNNSFVDKKLNERDDLYELPSIWKWEENQFISFEVKDGTHDTPKYHNKGIPFITQKNIREKGLIFDGFKLISIEDHNKFYRRSNVEKNDILISMIGANRGMSCIVHTDTTFSIKNVGLIKGFNPYSDVKYLQYYFSSFPGQNLIMKSSKGGAQPFIGLTELRNWPIPIPPLEEQTEIVRQVDKLFALADRLESHYQKAKARVDKLSQSVLAKTFRGELVITEAELAEKEGRDFESAEKLLERILEEKAKLVGSRQRAVGGVRSVRGSKGKQKETGGKKK